MSQFGGLKAQKTQGPAMTSDAVINECGGYVRNCQEGTHASMCQRGRNPPSAIRASTGGSNYKQGVVTKDFKYNEWWLWRSHHNG